MSEVIRRTLTPKQLIAALDRTPGLIPVGIEIDARRLVWRDLGTYHPYEGFFRDTLAAVDGLHALRRPGQAIEYLETDLDVLRMDAVVRDAIEPTGFIFHTGRCGSTLLAKVLARSRANLVFGEANPHQNIWPCLAKSLVVEPSPENLARYRRLVLAMGRRRLASHRWHFCKLASFDTLFVDFILQAFPQTPALYLYREPVEVLASMRKKRAGWLAYQGSDWGDFMAGRRGTGDVDEIAYFTEVLGHCMDLLLRSDAPLLHYLDYDLLQPQNLRCILEVFGVAYSESDLLQMRGQFDSYSKGEFAKVAFRSDRAEKRSALDLDWTKRSDRWLGPRFERLKAARRNIL